MRDGERESQAEGCLATHTHTHQEERKMDGERGYEWEEGLFF